MTARRWLLKFVRVRAEDGGCVCMRADCTEEELRGEKERAAMELERDTGEPWRCTVIVPIPETQKRRTGGDD